MDPAQAQRIARAGISGRPPVASPAAPSARAPVAPEPEREPENERDSDTRYMEPPSEALGRAQTEAVLQVPQTFARASDVSMSPLAPPPPSAAERGPGLLGSTLHRAAHPREPAVHTPAGAGLFSTSLSNMHDPEAPKPNAPRGLQTNNASNQAPEAWRDDVRRMAERSPVPPRPKVQPGPTASLRLKLDADAYEEQPYRAPKSALPSVLLWLLILGVGGGAAAYYVQGHGGVNAVVDRLRGVTKAPPPSAPPAAEAAPATPTLPPTAADQPQQPPAAAQPQQPAAAAAPTAEPPAQQPAAAATPTAQPSAAEEAQKLADPEPPAEAPAAAPAKPPAAAQATPAAPKKAEPKPKPKAPVRRHDPVVKVRPLDSTSTPAGNLDTPPAPPDMPYVPNPADPPAPDEPR